MDYALKSFSSSEIPHLIEKAAPFGGRVAQPAVSGSVSLIRKISVENGNLSLELCDEFPLDPRRPVTVQLNYRNISFFLETGEFRIHQERLHGTLPRRIRALGERDSERYVLPLYEQVTLSGRRAERRGSSPEFEARVIDLSPQGLGIVIASPEEDLLKKNDHLWIHTLSGGALVKPLFARVVYVFEKKFLDTCELRAGLRLSTEIPLAQLSELQKRCRLVLEA